MYQNVNVPTAGLTSDFISTANYANKRRAGYGAAINDVFGSGNPTTGAANTTGTDNNLDQSAYS